MIVKLKTRLSGSLPRHRLFSHFFPLILTLLFSTMFAQLSHSAEVTLAWDYSDQATGYYIYYGLESGNYSAKIDVGADLQYTIIGLDDFTSYYIAATAYNQFGESDFSEEIIYAPYACDSDIDFDGDIDGSDLVLYAEDAMGINLEAFIAKFGTTGCL